MSRCVASYHADGAVGSHLRAVMLCRSRLRTGGIALSAYCHAQSKPLKAGAASVADEEPEPIVVTPQDASTATTRGEAAQDFVRSPQVRLPCSGDNESHSVAASVTRVTSYSGLVREACVVLLTPFLL